MQVVYSHQVGHMHGDVAVTYGFQAVQVNSQVGKSHNGVSDKHDLVIATVFGNSKPSGATKTKGKMASARAITSACIHVLE